MNSKELQTTKTPESFLGLRYGAEISNLVQTVAGLVVMMMFLALNPDLSEAQQAGSSIIGQVVDAADGRPLAGATIQAKGNEISASTDANGRFIIRNVAAGEYRIEISAVGYQSIERSAGVQAGEDVTLYIPLISEPVEGIDHFLENHRQARLQAIGYRHTTTGFRSILTANQVDRFSDYSVADGLAHIPGMQTTYQGGLNLRGVGQDRYYVTVNGQRMPSTGLNDRSVDLGTISADMLSQVEVIKVLTPDMDADGLAGAINLRTHQPTGKRNLQISGGGGASTHYFNRTGPSAQAWASYSDSVSDGVSIALTLSHQLDRRAWDRLAMNYQTADFGSGPVDVLESVTPGLQTDGRQRLGGNLQLNFSPNAHDRYYLRATLNSDDRTQVLHSDSWRANGDWYNQDSTGATGELGTYWENASRVTTETRQFTFQAGGRHFLNQAELDYSAGWARTGVLHHDYLFPFRIAEVNHSINMDDRYRPTMRITNRETQILDDGNVDRRFMEGQNFDRTIEDHTENRFTATADLEIPISIGSIKTGVSSDFTLKEADFNRNSFEYSRDLRLINFNLLREPVRDVGVFEPAYVIPWLINTEDARNFLESQLPVFTGSDSLQQRSNIWSYNAVENIHAGYGMATLHFGKFSFIGGVRAEYMDATYEGNQILFNSDGEFEESTDTEEESSNLNLFPNAQLRYDVASNTSVQLAYSRTISRPNMNQLVPFSLRIIQNSTVFNGNPELDAMVSDNLDLFAERYLGSSGLASAGLFYKQLGNFIYERQQTLSQGPYAGYQERTFANSDYKATIYGAELSWHQRLSFLPGAFGNFGIFANYTWSQSEFETDQRSDVELPGQSPHVVNAAIDYSRGRFSGQVSYHWTAPALAVLRDQREAAPSVSSGNVYRDLFWDGGEDLSASFRFRISENFRFWANAYNILDSEQASYEHTRAYYPTEVFLREGLVINAGIRYEL